MLSMSPAEVYNPTLAGDAVTDGESGCILSLALPRRLAVCMLMSYNPGVPFLLDADALIKLNRAGVLEHVARTFECIVAEAVYHEVVTRGRAFHHPDAEELDRIIRESIAVQPSVSGASDILDSRGMPGVDAGERGVLDVYHSLSAGSAGEDLIIVSDDHRFLALLDHLEIPALVPMDFIVLMVRQGFLSRKEGRNAVEQMRPLIREAAFQRAWQDLEE